MDPEDYIARADRLFGKYRGAVVTNQDPLQRARLQVVVHILDTGRPMWAEPCIPYTETNERPAVPPPGTTVWVEFEEGDPQRPVWTGVWWHDQTRPANPPEA